MNSRHSQGWAQQKKPNMLVYLGRNASVFKVSHKEETLDSACSALPSHDAPFHVECDASDFAIGCALMQHDDADQRTCYEVPIWAAEACRAELIRSR